MKLHEIKQAHITTTAALGKLTSIRYAALSKYDQTSASTNVWGSTTGQFDARPDTWSWQIELVGEEPIDLEDFYDGDDEELRAKLAKAKARKAKTSNTDQKVAFEILSQASKLEGWGFQGYCLNYHELWQSRDNLDVSKLISLSGKTAADIPPKAIVSLFFNNKPPFFTTEHDD